MTAALVLIAAGAAFAFLRGRDAINDLDAQLDQLDALNASGDVLMEQDGSAAADEARRLRFPLPDNAADVHFARQGSAAASYWLRFSAPANGLGDLAACVETLESGYNPTFEYEVNRDVVANLDWWTPDTAAQYAGGQCVLNERARATLLVDQMQGDFWTFYVELITE